MSYKCTKANHNQNIIRVSLQENIPLGDRPICASCTNQFRSLLVQEAMALLPKIKPTSFNLFWRIQMLNQDIFNLKTQLISVIEKNFDNIFKMIQDETNQLGLTIDLIEKNERGNRFSISDIQNLGYIFTNEYLNKRNDFQGKIIQQKKELYDSLYAGLSQLKHQIEQKLPMSVFVKPKQEPPPVVINKINIDSIDKFQRFKYSELKKVEAPFDVEAIDFHIQGKYVAIKGKGRFQLLNLEERGHEINEEFEKGFITQIKFGHKGNWMLLCVEEDVGNMLYRYDYQEGGWLRTTNLALEEKKSFRHMEISTTDDDMLLYQEKYIVVLTQEIKKSGLQAVLYLVVKQKIELGSYDCPIYSKGFTSYFIAISEIEQQLKVYSNKNEKQWKSFSLIRLQEYEEIQDIQFIKPSTFALLFQRSVLQIWELYRDIFIMQNTITLEIDPIKFTLNALNGNLIQSNKTQTITCAINLRTKKIEKIQELEGGNFQVSEDAELLAQIMGKQVTFLKYEIV